MGILTDDPASEANRQLAERVSRFRSDVEASLSALEAPLAIPTLSEASEEARAIEAVREILEARAHGGQQDILRAVLQGSALCFRRSILFIGRDQSLVGWERRGFDVRGPGPDATDGRLRLGAAGDHLLARAHAGGALVHAGPEGPGDAVVQALGGPVPRSSAAAPLLVKERAVAVLYGDSPETLSDGRLALFDLLARIGGVSLEIRSSRRKLAAIAEAGTALPAPARAMLGRPGSPDVNPAAPEEAEMQALLGDLEPLPRREEGDRLSPEEQRQHNDARRFASLLVSELLLYNEEAVIQGRKQRDLSQRLAREIERTRLAYEARIPTTLKEGPRYLEDELLRVLADGDEALLTP